MRSPARRSASSTSASPSSPTSPPRSRSRLSAVIAGKGTVDAVLDDAQKQAQTVGDKYK
nr:hypothetical protein [Angustibacter aerolatus]